MGSESLNVTLLRMRVDIHMLQRKKPGLLSADMGRLCSQNLKFHMTMSGTNGSSLLLGSTLV